MDTNTVRHLADAIDACRCAASSSSNGLVDDNCQNAISQLTGAMKMAMESTEYE